MLFVTEPYVQLIMVSYFRPNDLNRCVSSIIKNTSIPFRLSIIDNSINNIDNVLDSFQDNKITIYRTNSNIGKGRAFMQYYDQIMDRYAGDYFISIDSDIIVQPEWLIRLLRAAMRIENLGILAPIIMKDQNDVIDKQLASKFTMHKKSASSRFIADNIYYNRYTSGPLLLINRNFFESIGGYSQNQLYGNDDGELCKAAYKTKRFVGIATDVAVLHSNIDSTPEYCNWKRQNIHGDVDGNGFWD